MYHLSDTTYDLQIRDMILIRTEQSFTRCIIVSLFYIYGSVIAMLIVSSVLIVRIWIIYDRRRVSAALNLAKNDELNFALSINAVASTVCAGCLVVSVPSLVLLQVQAQRKNLVPNPAPDFVTGCIFKPNPLAFIPYIAPFIYETMLFGMTVYKTWKISRGHMATPIITRLMRDGSNYYFVIIGTLIFVALGSLSPALSPAVNGSGIFLAVLSSMCSRLILSTRSFYDEAQVTDDFLEMETIPMSKSIPRSSAGVGSSTEGSSQNNP
ncbi:hypothetical protein FRC11_011578, partial [Ceratobasidium sp. 423]